MNALYHTMTETALCEGSEGSERCPDGYLIKSIWDSRNGCRFIGTVALRYDSRSYLALQDAALAIARAHWGEHVDI